MDESDATKLEKFARLVQAMRAHQREFFRTKKGAALDASKAAEQAVDAAVREILEPGLFPPDRGEAGRYTQGSGA